MKKQLTGLLLCLFSITGCVKETLDKCPEGNVRINIYAEKFQTNSTAATQDIEEQIGKRIDFLHCILYKGNDYVLDSLIENISGVNGSFFPIDFSGLPFGDYHLLVVGNCSPEAMGGDFHRQGEMDLLYLGADRTDDMFATLLPFTVDCDCSLLFETKLRRLLGVVRCEINGLPDAINELEVIFHNVNSRLSKDGIYSHTIDVSKRIPVVRTRNTQPQSILLGIFPTITDKPASYELKLYSDGQKEAVVSQVMPEDVNIVRNQLIELLSDYSGGKMQFTVRLDTKWEDYINGGEVEIH